MEKPMTQPELSAPLLLDRYQPVELLARGGSASVFRATDILLGRDVAVKVFSAGEETDVDKFREELRVLAAISHHGVVSVLDAGIDQSTASDPRPFLVMELVHGKTVGQLIDDGGLSILAIGGIAFEVAETLEYVHAQGIIHRDVSPSNIMLVDYGTGSSRPRARLTDFGLAVASGWISTEELAEGTVPYLSPEQALRYRLTTATDIYSLGLVLLECFTGTPAFPGEPVEAALARTVDAPPIPSSVPKPWRLLIDSMTKMAPEDRPSAADVLDSARGALRGMGRRTR